MHLMPMNATIQRKSTERYKLRVEKSVYDRLVFIARVLAKRRMVEHSLSEAFNVAMHYVVENAYEQAKILSRYYVRCETDLILVKITHDTKKRIASYSHELDATKMAFVDAVVTIFTKSLLSTIWRQKGNDYSRLIEEVRSISSTSRLKALKTPMLAEPKYRCRRKHKKGNTEMRHHNYIAEFREYMQKFGGIEQWLNKNVLVMIHAMPIEGSMGRTTNLDAPKETNPGTVFTVRFWKRGRGYNITILDSHDSYGENPPELETGSVYRLYDIHRNIDWLTLKTV